MLDDDSCASSVGAFLTGVAVTSGPWLLTTSLLVLMRITAVSAGIMEVTDAERVITIVYAVAIILGAPIDIVVTRFSADRVYERQPDRIAAPLRKVLAGSLVGFAGAGALVLWLCGTPPELLVPGTVLTAVVGAQWLLLSAAGGLSSPGIILRAFAVGAPLSLISWVGLGSQLGVAGYLSGFAVGQVATLGLLLWGIQRALPAKETEGSGMVAAARDYWLLAVAAFALNAGLWVDKLAVLAMSDASLASQYAALAAVAWLSVIPACGYLYLNVETVFYRRFHGYYSALHAGASLRELETLAGRLQSEVVRTLRGTLAVQAGVTMICLMLASRVVGGLGLGGAGAHTMVWLLVGAGLQVLVMAATLLLYYFDFRRDALIAAATQLVANTAFTFAVGTSTDSLGAGYALACAVTSVVATTLLIARMPRLLPRTFQSQPYRTEA